MAKKKKNAFARYFENFGFKQIGEISMVVALITLIVGWSICTATDGIVAVIAFGLFALSSLFSIFHDIIVIKTEKNPRSPERKVAKVGIIVSVAIFAVAVFGVIWGLTVGFVVPDVG